MAGIESPEGSDRRTPNRPPPNISDNSSSATLIATLLILFAVPRLRVVRVVPIKVILARPLLVHSPAHERHYAGAGAHFPLKARALRCLTNDDAPAGKTAKR